MEKRQNGLNPDPFSQTDAANPPLSPNSQFQRNIVKYQGDLIDYPTAKFDKFEETQAKLGLQFDPNIDPKKLRRLLANRNSAHRSRVRKANYLADLELKAKAIQDEIAGLQQNIASNLNVKLSLLMERETLANQVAILHRETLFKSAKIDELKVEANKLRELYAKQQEQLHWNTSMQPTPKDSISNYYSNSYNQAPTPSEKWIPDVRDENEIDLTMLTNLWSMDNVNLTWLDAQNPNLKHDTNV